MIENLVASPRPCVLMVTHAWEGGVARHVADLARLLADDCEVLRMKPGEHGSVEIAWMREGEDLHAWFEAGEWEAVVQWLRAAGVGRIHFHHVHGLPREVLELPARLAVPYDVTLHDYYPVCASHHLAPAGGTPCDSDAAPCDRCLPDGGATQWGLDLQAWRALLAGFLHGAERVIVPSRDMEERMRRWVPGLAPLQWPHPEPDRPAPATHRVALLGGASAIKGARLLEACAADAAARGLPLHFHVIGPVDRPMATFPAVPLTIGGSYAEESLPRLVAIERPDAFVFLSQVAETYSYALSAAMRTGLPVVATRVGAFPERLGKYPAHALVPRDASAAQVNDALLALLPASALPAAPGARERIGMDPAAYRERLLAGYGGKHAPRPVASAILAAHSNAPRSGLAPQAGLRDLYDAGIRCGHGGMRAQLEARLAHADEDLDRAQSGWAGARVEAVVARADLEASRREFEHRQRDLHADVAAARARIDELEKSTFWRATLPFRAALHQAKRAVQAVRAIGAPRSEPKPGQRFDAGEGPIGRRILVVEASVLTPDEDAGSLRMTRLIALMREQGCQVTFFAIEAEGYALDELLRERGACFDVVILARHHVAVRYIDTVRLHAPRALLVFDTVDLHFVRQRRRAQVEVSEAAALSAEATYREEVDCIRRCDVTWVVSDVERDVVVAEVPDAVVLVQSTVYEPHAAVAPFAGRAGILFVGSFRHPPNVDAVLYLAREIVPLLARRLPGVTTYLVGSDPPAALASLATDGLEVVGHVEKVEPWLDRCRVSVSPLRYGAGVKGKVNQAMSRGLPVVATRASIEGLHVADGEEVLVGDDPMAIAAAIARLYRDEALWQRLSRGGIANVERHFSPAVAARALAALLEIAARRVT